MALKTLGSFACLALVLGGFGCSGASEEKGRADNAGAGGTAGTPGGEPLDDPFGVGGRPCDNPNHGWGGDGCVGAWNSAGFFTDPEHMSSGNPGTVRVALSVLTEYTPNTPLKLAVESGVALTPYGSTDELPFEASWSVLEDDWAIVYTLTPHQVLADGAYSFFIRQSVREAHVAQYRGHPSQPFTGGPFVELESGDLRADFRVGL
jgi:hypothetical protein